MTTLPFKDCLCPQSKPSPVVLLPLPLTETAWLVDFLKPFKFSKVATELDCIRKIKILLNRVKNDFFTSLIDSPSTR